MPAFYINITSEAKTQYSQNGWSATQVDIYDQVDMSNPDATLTNTINDLAPQRGDPHPSGEDMQADVIVVDAISSNQVKVTTTYRKLSAIDQEPDDSTPGLMTIGSSVQQSQTALDYKGAQLVTPYISIDGPLAYAISNSLTSQAIAEPSNVAIVDTQIPNTIIRFQRREQNIPTDKIQAYVGQLNNSPCSWNGFSAAAQTLLCTRIESQTNDNGFSYVVEYEFQHQPKTWSVGAFYVLPNYTQGQSYTDNSSLGPGDQPIDAAPTIFQIYGTQEFNALGLA